LPEVGGVTEESAARRGAEGTEVGAGAVTCTAEAAEDEESGEAAAGREEAAAIEEGEEGEEGEA
jgi:hypothetical protein